MSPRIRRPSRFLATTALAGLMGLAAAAPVAAAPYAGCAAGPSGWAELDATDTAILIWPSVVDTSPWPGGLPDFIVTIEGLDLNGDGDLCLKRIGSEGWNPNSNWYGVVFNYVLDNTANASDG